MMQEETILIEATISDDGFPAVLVAFEGCTEVKPVEEIRSFAIALLNAAAIAENEVAIFDGFYEMDRTPKGFSKRVDADSAAVKAVQLLRTFRPEMPFKIQCFRGMVSGEALVQFPWPSRKKGLQFDVVTARSHAKNLLEAAEASETDSFLRHFMMFKLDQSSDHAQAMVIGFREFRTRVRLENMLKQK